MNKEERFLLTNVIETDLEILKRHIHVLKVLQENQPLSIIKLAKLTKYPKHMVRYSLRMLEQDGIIEPSSHGAVTTEKAVKTAATLKKALKRINSASEEMIKTLE
jgi:predicted transcriptional regulator